MSDREISVDTSGKAAGAITIDQLSQLDYAELDALFRRSSAPASLAALGNDAGGRALAVRGADHGRIARAIRAVEGSRLFPWVGKTLTWEPDGKTGSGTNRVQFGRQWFPYNLRFGQSIIDQRASIVFDYDHPGNNALGRKLYNELREVSPGLFLGPVTWRKRDGSRRQLMWFAVKAPDDSE
ncbi:hypothetical protein GOEFS_062_00330 [Gordonia effusa NBRC 100432]|uniref:Uncharacterized protein n=1 Tax=Gordonia effusa NBRC 100432 TaxID=1077974 RepID=H0R0X3_9ACTN|nr:hypothetical protein [Gordonia effusa]GAB18724.1 hypothetical protein GOEFS_062_00330 [Gordonia effusa NBRC 100432]